MAVRHCRGCSATLTAWNVRAYCSIACQQSHAVETALLTEYDTTLTEWLAASAAAFARRRSLIAITDFKVAGFPLIDGGYINED